MPGRPWRSATPPRGCGAGSRLRPKPWFDPFGSGFIASMVALLWSVQAFMMPAAYAKPAPIDTNYLRRHPRDVVLVSLAGPVASLALAVLGGS